MPFYYNRRFSGKQYINSIRNYQTIETICPKSIRALKQAPAFLSGIKGSGLARELEQALETYHRERHGQHPGCTQRV